MDTNFLILIVALFVILLVVAAFKKRTSDHNEQSVFYLKQNFMNSSEHALFINLTKQFGSEYIILSKVRIEDFVGVKKDGLPENKRFGQRNKIKSRHVDFLICDLKSTRPLMVVELDGGSHNASIRKKRDDVLDGIYNDIKIAHVHVRVGIDFEKKVEEIKSLLINNDAGKK